MQVMKYQRRGMFTHSRISNRPRSLNMDDLLHEFDAAYPDGMWRRIHSLEDIMFYCSHLLPGDIIVWVVDSKGRKLVRQSKWFGQTRRATWSVHADIFTRCYQESGEWTYTCLKTKGYRLDAVCTTLLITAKSSALFSRSPSSVDRTVPASCSLRAEGRVGFAKVSARNSEPHRRSSNRVLTPMIGKIPWMTCG